MEMTLTERFSIGDFACYYDKSPPENAVGIVTSATDKGLTIQSSDGKETTYSKEEAAEMVQSCHPDPENTLSGLPVDPEVWDIHHTHVFREREYGQLQKRETAARSELADILQCPASWTFLLPKIRKLVDASKKRPNAE